MLANWLDNLWGQLWTRNDGEEIPQQTSEDGVNKPRAGYDGTARQQSSKQGQSEITSNVLSKKKKLPLEQIYGEISQAYSGE